MLSLATLDKQGSDGGQIHEAVGWQVLDLKHFTEEENEIGMCVMCIPQFNIKGPATLANLAHF